MAFGIFRVHQNEIGLKPFRVAQKVFNGCRLKNIGGKNRGDITQLVGANKRNIISAVWFETCVNALAVKTSYVIKSHF